MDEDEEREPSRRAPIRTGRGAHLVLLPPAQSGLSLSALRPRQATSARAEPRSHPFAPPSLDLSSSPLKPRRSPASLVSTRLKPRAAKSDMSLLVLSAADFAAVTASIPATSFVRPLSPPPPPPPLIPRTLADAPFLAVHHAQQDDGCHLEPGRRRPRHPEPSGPSLSALAHRTLRLAELTRTPSCSASRPSQSCTRPCTCLRGSRLPRCVPSRARRAFAPFALLAKRVAQRGLTHTSLHPHRVLRQPSRS